MAPHTTTNATTQAETARVRYGKAILKLNRHYTIPLIPQTIGEEAKREFTVAMLLDVDEDYDSVSLSGDIPGRAADYLMRQPDTVKPNLPMPRTCIDESKCEIEYQDDSLHRIRANVDYREEEDGDAEHEEVEEDTMVGLEGGDDGSDGTVGSGTGMRCILAPIDVKANIPLGATAGNDNNISAAGPALGIEFNELPINPSTNTVLAPTTASGATAGNGKNLTAASQSIGQYSLLPHIGAKTNTLPAPARPKPQTPREKYAKTRAQAKDNLDILYCPLAAITNCGYTPRPSVRPTHIMTHLREDHSIPLEKVMGGQIDKTREKQREQYLEWCKEQGLPEDDSWFREIARRFTASGQNGKKKAT
jgi:hypothetical protein